MEGRRELCEFQVLPVFINWIWDDKGTVCETEFGPHWAKKTKSK